MFIQEFLSNLSVNFLNPEERTTNALSTIYQMLHVFFPLNYNLKKKKKNSLK